MTQRVRINDLSLYAHDDDGGLHWDGNADLEAPGGGTDAGKILVALDVDGNLICVYGDLGPTGDITALSRSIEALTELRDHLSALYDGHPHEPGRCVGQGDWGRCQGRQGYNGDHDYPRGLAAS